MDKRRYYVSVQAKDIMYQQGDAAYEFEIDATQEDIDKLQELFLEMDKFDNQSALRGHLPGIPYHHDLENDGYDYYLNEAYRLIGELGTAETREHIATMNLKIE
ncbi:hypothetical protein [Paenibacillus sp. HB172176]|uniref:hypothetical protein n=1 Tax=Paenibacillus sp. HB172176 TaxID=2493690 RepID=UPI00143C262A|nr:hypothetical protein [Paenibacillus sp. HB172176]